MSRIGIMCLLVLGYSLESTNAATEQDGVPDYEEEEYEGTNADFSDIDAMNGHARGVLSRRAQAKILEDGEKLSFKASITQEELGNVPKAQLAADRSTFKHLLVAAWWASVASVFIVGGVFGILRLRSRKVKMDYN